MNSNSDNSGIIGDNEILKIQSILNSEYFPLFTFFIDIYIKMLNNENTIFAFVNRRCHVLFELFSNVIKYYINNKREIENIELIELREMIIELTNQLNDSDNMNKLISSSCVTSSVLINMGENFAELFNDNDNEKSKLPDIYLVDDLMIYGRTINNILTKFEDMFTAYLIKNNIDENKQIEAIEQLRLKIHVKIYTKNDNTLLLYPRYSKNLEFVSSTNKSNINIFSYRVYSLLSKLLLSTATFSWAQKLSYKDYNAIFDNNNNVNNFTTTQTKFDNFTQKLHLWKYEKDNQVKALATIRVKYDSNVETAEPENLLIIPYFIFGETKVNNYIELINTIKEDINKHEGAFKFYSVNDENINNKIPIELYYFRMSQSVHLYLSSLILLYYLKQNNVSKDKVKDILKHTNYSFIARNFYNNTSKCDSLEVEKNLKDIIDYQIEQYDNIENDIEKYMNILLEDTDNLWDNNLVFTNEEINEENSDYNKKLVELFASEISTMSEREAFLKTNGNISSINEELRFKGRDIDLSECLNSIYEESLKDKNDNKFNLSLVISYIVQMMSVNVFGMEPDYNAESKKIYTTIRHGEPASFQLIKRYSEHLPALNRIFNEWKFQSYEFDELLWYYCNKKDEKNSSTMFNDLIEIGAQLISSGQKITDWLFPMYKEKEN